MSRIKLTPFAKILIFIVIIGVVGGGLYKTGKIQNLIATKSGNTDKLYKEVGTIHKESGTMNISLDEWLGWKPIIDANGGLTTKSGSIYDKLGLKLNISVINDGSQSSNALIKGDLNGAGYTVNRYAFLYPKFKDNNIATKMVYVTNSSSGGDGIIAKKGINRIEDLVGKKIAVPRYSEAQTLVEWLMSKSSLTPDQISKIRDNMVFTDSPDDCAKAFFAGKVDAAATWQPYISQAMTTAGTHVLFSTKDATNIILDGIVFRKDYLDSNKEQVSKFIEGALKASSLYNTDMTSMKNTFPMYTTSTDEDIKGSLGDATIANVKTNVDDLNNDDGVARELFSNMSDIWKSIGEKSNRADTSDAFDDSFVKELVSKFPDSQEQTVKITDKEKTTAQTQDNNKALLTKRLSINFETNSSAISPDSYSSLSDFANTAKILNGTVIQIEGNTDNTGDNTINKPLSAKRAQAVAIYLQSQGVDSSRFIVVGNGSDKPLGSNDTDAGKEQNRRTDMYFKTVK